MLTLWSHSYFLLSTVPLCPVHAHSACVAAGVACRLLLPTFCWIAVPHFSTCVSGFTFSVVDCGGVSEATKARTLTHTCMIFTTCELFGLFLDVRSNRQPCSDPLPMDCLSSLLLNSLLRVNSKVGDPWIWLSFCHWEWGSEEGISGRAVQQSNGWP